MPRKPRIVFPDLPHHVVQRGNRRGAIFYSDSDRVTYLDWLTEYCRLGGTEVLAYCLMTNHVHFVVVPRRADSLERTFQPLHVRYAQRINRARDWKGHLLQGRFFSAVLDDSYLWSAIRYVERNPVRAGMVDRAEAYRWSSAAAHSGLRADPVLTSNAAWRDTLAAVGDWSGWLGQGDEYGRIDALREAVYKCLPCGGEEFVRRLEVLSGRDLRARPKGRPRKEACVPFSE